MPLPVRGHRALRRLLICVALAAGFAAPGNAQHPGVPHDRSLAARLALADAIAIATVLREEPGRLDCGEVRVLEGSLPESFAVKRAPSAPPPLGVGDRAIFLLRGARPPYVLVDQPKETIRLADAAAEERWADAISGWLAVRDRPAAWPALYAGWIDDGPDTLRELAVNGLSDPAAPFQPIPEATAAAYGDLAWDAARPISARRAYALLASLTQPGSDRLVEGFRAAPRLRSITPTRKCVVRRSMPRSSSVIARIPSSARASSASRARTRSHGSARRRSGRSPTWFPSGIAARRSEAAGSSRASDGARLVTLLRSGVASLRRPRGLGSASP